MRRLIAVLLVASLAAACSNGGGIQVELGEPDGGGGGGGNEPGATSPPPPGPSTPGGGEGQQPPSKPAGDEDDGSSGSPGAFARTLLRPRPATAIVFELFQQKGAEPRSGSVDHAKSVLRSVTRKSVADPSPIEVPGGAQQWTPGAIRETADRLTKAGQGGGRAVLHVLFLRGNLKGNDEVLGVAVRGDVLAIFSDSVAAAGTPLVSGRAIEEAVLMHELGHLLGLVDLALDTGRDDPEHPGHSRNSESVMYWAVESSLVTQVLSGGPPRDFDRQDLADLAALRDGA